MAFACGAPNPTGGAGGGPAAGNGGEGSHAAGGGGMAGAIDRGGIGHEPSGGVAGAAGRGGGEGGGDAGAGAGGAASGGTIGAGGKGGGGGSVLACPGATYAPATPPATLTLSGDLGAHDPAVYVEGTTIYLAATGLTAKKSTDLTSWSSAANPLPLPSWAASATGATSLWAPDISQFGGTYHLYYSASTFGSNKSCIGQATRAALGTGAWEDQGMVICSNMGTKDDWNAIDPNVALDDEGAPWLVFGSFWSGIKAVKLDASGKRADTTVHALANNTRGIEGAWVFKRCGSYYLFVSTGACCDGAYDYKIQVGRSSSLTGPYLDKSGMPMMSGGGTLLVEGNADWVAPGHNAVFARDGKTYNVYHALRGSSRGPATLRIAELVWDASGWPVSGGP